jgi:hypothetical protein
MANFFDFFDFFGPWTQVAPFAGWSPSAVRFSRPHGGAHRHSRSVSDLLFAIRTDDHCNGRRRPSYGQSTSLTSLIYLNIRTHSVGNFVVGDQKLDPIFSSTTTDDAPRTKSILSINSFAAAFNLKMSQ